MGAPLLGLVYVLSFIKYQGFTLCIEFKKKCHCCIYIFADQTTR